MTGNLILPWTGHSPSIVLKIEPTAYGHVAGRTDVIRDKRATELVMRFLFKPDKVQ